MFIDNQKYICISFKSFYIVTKFITCHLVIHIIRNKYIFKAQQFICILYSFNATDFE